MAPMAATLVNDAAVENVIAYIQTFPDEPAPHTIDGDAANGKDSYRLCAYCHGDDGMGIQALNAPRLAGDATIEGLLRRDFYVMMACTIMVGIMTQLGILLSDISYSLVDPRIRHD